VSVIILIIAWTFHSSVILAIPIFIIFSIFSNNKLSNKQKKRIAVIIVMIVLMLVMGYEDVLYMLSHQLGIVPEIYYDYLNSSFRSEELVIGFSEVVLRAIWLSLGAMCLYINRNKNEEDKFAFYYFLLIIESLLFFISLRITNSDRIGYYYLYIGMLYVIPAMRQMVKKNVSNSMAIHIMLVGILLAFWIWKYPITKNTEAYPYRSDVVRILN
jgi:hypothetical protein